MNGNSNFTKLVSLRLPWEVYNNLLEEGAQKHMSITDCITQKICNFSTETQPTVQQHTTIQQPQNSIVLDKNMYSLLCLVADRLKVSKEDILRLYIEGYNAGKFGETLHKFVIKDEDFLRIYGKERWEIVEQLKNDNLY